MYCFHPSKVGVIAMGVVEPQGSPLDDGVKAFLVIRVFLIAEGVAPSILDHVLPVFEEHKAVRGSGGVPLLQLLFIPMLVQVPKTCSR